MSIANHIAKQFIAVEGIGMDDLISVIVPIYKVEEYLKKCVDSIINQTYKNLEIILVDDGSPDSCGKICDFYSNQDHRIRVIHKKNGGLSDARNVALDVASGAYITFIDSDDYIEENYISYLYNLVKKNNADISICEYLYITEKGKVINHPRNDGKIIIMDQEKALYELLNSKLYSNSAWGKLYKKECFSGIRYPYGKLYEDVPTTYKTFLKCNKIVFGASAKYFYLYRSTAISKQKFSLKRMDAIYFTEEMVKNIIEKFPSLSRIAECRLFDSYIAVLALISSKNCPEIYSLISRKIKEKRRRILLYKLSGRKRKLQAFFSYIGIGFLKMIVK